MTDTLLVTGATGTVGSEVVKRLTARGLPVRAGVHTPEKARRLDGLDVEVVELEYREPRTVAAALAGVSRALLVIEDLPDHGELAGRLAATAREAGVEHLVKLSAMGADRGSYTLGDWHGDAEKAIAAAGVSYTFVRPNSFMQNFLTWYRPRFGRIFLPMGEGEVSWVDARDVAAVVVAALTEDGHRGKAYEVTGPEALSVGRVAEVISQVTGKRVRYADIPEDFARKTMEKLGSPEWFVDGIVEMHRVNKAGEYSTVTACVEEVTGSEATSFERFVTEFADDFRRIAA